MTVSYIAPLERAWDRSRDILFRPFDPERWIVIGFASFLAALVGGWAGVSFRPGGGFRISTRIDELSLTPWEFVWDSFSPMWLVGAPFLALGVIVGIALLWLSSRGKFVFLENLVEGRGAIVEPWKRLRRLGNSLFFWRLGLALVYLLVLGTISVPMLMAGAGARRWEALGPLSLMVAFGSFAAALIVSVVAAYATLFLEGFVIPIMYRSAVSTTEAWRRFLPLLRRHTLEFLLFGLIVAAGWVVVGVCLLIAGVASCCLLFVIVSVPYVNAVFLLPISSVFRLYTVEFLEQFGPEFRVLPDRDPTPPPTPSGGPDEPAPPPPAPEPPKTIEAPPPARSDDGDDPIDGGSDTDDR